MEANGGADRDNAVEMDVSATVKTTNFAIAH